MGLRLWFLILARSANAFAKADKPDEALAKAGKHSIHK
jgi:hypothetical protein